jgi:Protein of unknown function (DUF2934)
MSEREQQVREIAHRLWEEEGRPSDQEKRHWATAERMFDAARGRSAGSDAQPASATGAGKRGAARKGAKRTPAGSEIGAARTH